MRERTPTKPRATHSPADDDARRTLDDLISRAIAYHSVPELKELFDFVRNFRYVAPFNALLLHIQNPGIQFALRASQWDKIYRRRIRPGARPYVILRTMGPVEFVFDLSDTEPINPAVDLVPEVAVNPFAVTGTPPKDVYRKVPARCLRIGVEILEQDFATGRAGEAGRNPKRKPPYAVVLNVKHTDAQKLGTLAHELAHIFCGHLGEA
jgi:hypothetical protein